MIAVTLPDFKSRLMVMLSLFFFILILLLVAGEAFLLLVLGGLSFAYLGYIESSICIPSQAAFRVLICTFLIS